MGMLCLLIPKKLFVKKNDSRVYLAMSAIIGKKCNISSISSKPPIGGYRLSLIYIHYICQASKLTLTTMARKEYISRPTAQKYLNCDRNTLMKLIENDTIKHQRREDGGWQIGI